MSLLSGLKFVGKKTEKKEDEGSGKGAAPKGMEMRASMDWMTGPIDLLGRKKEEPPPPPDAETLAKQAEEEAEQKRLQDDIDKGLRDKSGLLYGLNVMSKAEDGGLTSSRCETFVGDNGASWRAKALKRAKEEAHRTGRSLEEVVKDRWGSLQELKKGLDESGRAVGPDRRKSWKREQYRSSDDADRRKREDEGWRRVFSATGEGRKPRLSVGREQTDKELISRFSQKLNEALGKVEDDTDGKEEGGRGRKRSRSRDRERDWRADERRGGRRSSRSRERERRRSRSGERRERRRREDHDRDEEQRGSRRRREEEDEEAPVVVGGGAEPMEEEERSSKKAQKGEEVKEKREEEAKQPQQQQEKAEAPEAGPGPDKAKEQEAEEDEGGAAMAVEEEDEEDEERAMAERRARRQAALASFQAKAAAAPPPAPARQQQQQPTPAQPSAAPVADPNKLAAQALKAKLKGDKATHDRLMKEAEDARAQIEASKAAKAKQEEERAQTEVVVPLDRHGRPIQLSKAEELRREDMRRGARQGKLKQSEQWGQNVELEELVRREKMGGDDMDREFARNIMRLGSRYKGTEMKTGDGAGMDEEDYIDTRMFEKSEDRLTDKQRRKKQEAAAVRELGKWQQATEKCGLCNTSESFKKHLMASLGEHVYLLLRTGASALVPGHCAIVPVKHVESLTACDEEVVAEVDRFKESLRRMQHAAGKSVLFLDTWVSQGRKRHLAIEAIPVPRSVALDAPLYFKQGLMEVDEQWSTHKKLIDTKGRSIRSVVPKNFPYFHVDWGDGGYAHVVEDRDQFPADFGVGVVAGMLGVDPPRFDRRNQRVDLEQEKAAMREFLRGWQAHDWTAELEGGEYLK